MSFLSDLLPSRSLFGTVPNSYLRSLHHSSVQKLFLGRSLPHMLAFQWSLWKCVPPMSSLSDSLISGSRFGAIPATTGGLSSICLCRSCCCGGFSHVLYPLELYLEFVTFELSLRPIVGYLKKKCCFCNLFDAHGGWVRDRRLQGR